MQKIRKIKNTHDKVYRDILMDKTETAELLNTILKLENKLNKEDIEQYNTNFITVNYQNKQSDTIYKLKDKNIFFLIEHQSKVDYTMPYRILNYSIETIKSIVENSKKIGAEYKYPIVIPIVIYTGNNRWNIKTSLKEVSQQLEGYEKMSVNVEYNLIDISNKNKLVLANSKLLIYKVIAMEKCKTREELVDIINIIIENTKEEKAKQKIERIIRYILTDNLKNKDIKEFISKLNNEEVKMYTLKQNLLREEKMLRRSGFKDGKKEGIKEGMQQKMISIIKTMLKYGESEEKIQKYTQMPIEEIQKLKNA